MKKIIIILFVLLFTSGCYDNIELNSIDIVSGVGIKYEQNEYTVTYEIVNTKKSNGDSSKSFIHTGSGKTVADAFNATDLSIDRNPYFAHVKLFILHSSITGDHLKEVLEYVFRDYSMRDEFKVIYTEDDPKEIFKSSNEHNPIVSMEILNMLRNNSYTSNNAIQITFEKFFSKIINDLEDPIVSTISLNKKEIKLNKGVVFHNYDIVDYLTLEETSLYNLLLNISHGTLLTHEYNNKTTAINLYGPKIKIELKDHTIKITGTVEGYILSNNAKLDLRKSDAYNKLNQDFSNLLNKKVSNMLKKLQLYESDILSLGNMYYEKMRIKEEDIWLNYDIDTDIDVKINKKGFIFEVNYE